MEAEEEGPSEPFLLPLSRNGGGDLADESADGSADAEGAGDVGVEVGDEMLAPPVAAADPPASDDDAVATAAAPESAALLFALFPVHWRSLSMTRFLLLRADGSVQC